MQNEVEGMNTGKVENLDLAFDKVAQIVAQTR